MITVDARHGLSLEHGKITGIPHISHWMSKYHTYLNATY